jgi:DNA-binding NarL/FixJ family response regulator
MHNATLLIITKDALFRARLENQLIKRYNEVDFIFVEDAATAKTAMTQILFGLAVIDADLEKTQWTGALHGLREATRPMAALVVSSVCTQKVAEEVAEYDGHVFISKAAFLGTGETLSVAYNTALKGQSFYCENFLRAIFANSFEQGGDSFLLPALRQHQT